MTGGSFTGVFSSKLHSSETATDSFCCLLQHRQNPRFEKQGDIERVTEGFQVGSPLPKRSKVLCLAEVRL